MSVKQLQHENYLTRGAGACAGLQASARDEEATTFESLPVWNENDFEQSSTPMSQEDWSVAKEIVDRLRAAGVSDIRGYVQANPSLLAELAPAVKILKVNAAAVKTYRAGSREELLAAFNAPPDLKTYNPVTGLSDIFVELVHRFAGGETDVVLEGPDTALDGSVIYIRTTTRIVRGREDDWGRVIQTVEDFTPLLPQVRNSLLLREKFIALVNQHRTIEGLLNSLTTPSLLVDGRGVVVECNLAAERLFADSRSLSLVRGRLSTGFAEEDKRIREAVGKGVSLARTCPGEAGQPQRVQISRASSNRPYSLMIYPLPRNASCLDLEVAAVIYIADPEKLREADVAGLADFYGLTKSEQLLCQQLLCGLSLIEAAKALRITQGTARQRLKTVFRKTDTGSQADLIRLMMTYLRL